jgi:hypothetical protein
MPTVKGRQPSTTVKGRQPSTTVKGRQPSTTVEGCQPSTTVEGRESEQPGFCGGPPAGEPCTDPVTLEVVNNP